MKVHDVSLFERCTDKSGIKYLKGAGKIYFENPKDPRPSRMIFVKQVSTKIEQQMNLIDYKIPKIEIQPKFRIGQEIIYTPIRTKTKIRGTILKIYKTTFGSSLKDKALSIGLFKLRNGRWKTTIRAINAKVKTK